MLKDLKKINNYIIIKLEQRMLVLEGQIKYKRKQQYRIEMESWCLSVKCRWRDVINIHLSTNIIEALLQGSYEGVDVLLNVLIDSVECLLPSWWQIDFWVSYLFLVTYMWSRCLKMSDSAARCHLLWPGI